MNWVLPMWVGSLRRQGGFAHSGAGPIYEEHQTRLVELLTTYPSQVVMLTHPSDPGVFFGFGCGSPRAGGGAVLHYLAIKSDFRKLGLGTILLAQLIELFDPGPLEYTHTTRGWRRMTACSKATYNPYQAIWAVDAICP